MNEEKTTRYVRVRVCACEDGSPINEYDCVENAKRVRAANGGSVPVMVGSRCVGHVIKLEYDQTASTLWAIFETDEGAFTLNPEEIESGAEWKRRAGLDWMLLAGLRLRPKK